MNFEELFAALLGAPSLPGARCRGRPHLFDDRAPGEDSAVVAARHSQALALCNRCPALERCAAWLDSLHPRQRPHGVVGGKRILAAGAARKQRDHDETG